MEDKQIRNMNQLQGRNEMNLQVKPSGVFTTTFTTTKHEFAGKIVGVDAITIITPLSKFSELNNIKFGRFIFTGTNN